MGVGDSCNDDDDDDDDDDDNGDDDYVTAELKQQRNDTNKKLGEKKNIEKCKVTGIKMYSQYKVGDHLILLFA